MNPAAMLETLTSLSKDMSLRHDGARMGRRETNHLCWYQFARKSVLTIGGSGCVPKLEEKGVGAEAATELLFPG